MHVVIVGTGPAGVSAALYARRGGAGGGGSLSAEGAQATQCYMIM